MPNLFLGLTGSVATIKLPHLIREALARNFDVKWSATASAEPFVQKALMRLGLKAEKWLNENSDLLPPSPSRDMFVKALPKFAEMGMNFTAEGKTTDFESDTYKTIDAVLARLPEFLELPESLQLLKEISERREPGIDVEGVKSDEKGHVLHINTAEWADIVLIAPATANTLAKVVYGITDNFILEVARAMPVEESTVVIAPAMNTNMWFDPATQRNVKVLSESMFSVKYELIPPIEKELQCGMTGIGAMEEPEKIMDFVAGLLA